MRLRSISICIETEKGTALITDSFLKYGNIKGGYYLGVMESMMEADASWKGIKQESSLVASVYDPEFFKRFPGGVLA